MWKLTKWIWPLKQYQTSGSFIPQIARHKSEVLSYRATELQSYSYGTIEMQTQRNMEPQTDWAIELQSYSYGTIEIQSQRNMEPQTYWAIELQSYRVTVMELSRCRVNEIWSRRPTELLSYRVTAIQLSRYRVNEIWSRGLTAWATELLSYGVTDLRSYRAQFFFCYITSRSLGTKTNAWCHRMKCSVWI